MLKTELELLSSLLHPALVSLTSVGSSLSSSFTQVTSNRQPNIQSSKIKASFVRVYSVSLVAALPSAPVLERVSACIELGCK